jgi:hypothetical protein
LLELEKMTPQSQALLDKQKIIYEYFFGAFHPGSELRKKLESRFRDKLKDEDKIEIEFKEDEIYPGIKRPQTKNEKEDTTKSSAQGPPVMTSSTLISFFNGGHGKGKVAEGNGKYLESCDRKWLNKWEEYNLDSNFMRTFLNFLKVEDKSEYRPLDDMNLDTYNVLRDAWTHNRLKFMQSQFWVSGILGNDETLRRLKTMALQIAEITVVQNWKIIKRELINKNQLTMAEAREIERFYNLLIQFPNPIKYKPKPMSPRIVTSKTRPIVKFVEKSLGIFESMRPDPVPILRHGSFSDIFNLLPQIHSMRRHNGFDILAILWARKLFKQDPKSATGTLETMAEDGIVTWQISFEKHWLDQQYKLTIQST